MSYSKPEIGKLSVYDKNNFKNLLLKVLSLCFIIITQYNTLLSNIYTNKKIYFVDFENRRFKSGIGENVF